MNLSQNQNNLPRGAIGFALGIAGMLVSLYYSIMFISGNATGIEVVIGVIFALTLDYGKVALASEAILALVQFRLISAVVYTLIVITLCGLSMLAATFMLTSHNTSAGVEMSDSRITSIQQSIAAKRAELDKCPAGVMTKCITPRTAELNTLQAELSKAQNVSGDVIDAKNTAATWEKMAKALGTTPEELQIKLAFVRALLLEIIAPIFVSIFLTAYRNRLPTAEPQLHERVIENAAPSPSAQVFHSEPSISLPKQSAMNMTKLEKKL